MVGAAFGEGVGGAFHCFQAGEGGMESVGQASGVGEPGGEVDQHEDLQEERDVGGESPHGSAQEQKVATHREG
ncbi:hypothetical protein GCM10009550_65520 [Actinocorallia libanotica]|uniref:Uncharacterized protein n=1 Tax=Actinocorallia libanotica TaxID=46162 RepID=A0ABP4CFB7_9ACTN